MASLSCCFDWRRLSEVEVLTAMSCMLYLRVNWTSVISALGRTSLRWFRMAKQGISSEIADPSLELMRVLLGFEIAAGLVVVLAGVEGLDVFLQATSAQVC